MSGEQGYLNLLRSVLENGEKRQTRNAITYSQFGAQLRFNCRESFPLLTTKRVFFRGIVEELLWFIRGDTNADHLAEKGVHIWDGNSSREYLDSIGLNQYAPGDCGPVYGYQWRRWNEYYMGPGKNNGEGVDGLTFGNVKVLGCDLGRKSLAVVNDKAFTVGRPGNDSVKAVELGLFEQIVQLDGKGRAWRSGR